MKTNRIRITLASVLAGAGLILPPMARAHCDTMDGPVVQTAKAALEKKEVAPVLKWVKPEHEAEIKDVFAKALAVRTQGAEARELADRLFFETLVRIHRAGEGAPFTGLKPAGADLGPAIEGADQALERGSVDAVVKLVTEDVAAGIRRRFEAVRQKQDHAEHSVAAGRQFVAAYVDYVHYVEGVHRAAQGAGAHTDGAPAKAVTQAHEHQHQD